MDGASQADAPKKVSLGHEGAQAKTTKFFLAPPSPEALRASTSPASGRGAWR